MFVIFYTGIELSNFTNRAALEDIHTHITPCTVLVGPWEPLL